MKIRRRGLILGIIGGLVLPCLCLSADPNGEPIGASFRLATIELTRPCLSWEELKPFYGTMSWEFKRSTVKYRFMGKLPQPVQKAETLRYKQVVLADGETLSYNRVAQSGTTFAGMPASYHSTSGIELDPNGEWLLVDLEILSDRVVDFARIEGRIDLTYGEGPEPMVTGLLEDEEDFRDEESGTVVKDADSWVSGSRLRVVIPYRRGRIGKVEALNAKGNVLELGMPPQIHADADGPHATSVGLYVKKPPGTPFKLRVEVFDKTRTVTTPLHIENVKATVSEAPSAK